MNKQDGILIKKPISLLKRSLKADYSRFMEALTKTVAYGSVGIVESAMIEAKGIFSALGLQKDCSQVAWFLIHSALLQAVKELIDKRITSLPPEFKENQKREQLIKQLDLLFEKEDIFIDHHFFSNPHELKLLTLFETPLSQWLATANAEQTNEILRDLPDYFVFALKSQWGNNYKGYECLKEVLDTPFTSAYQRELAWMNYTKQLQKQVDNIILDERFNLRQVYVPLRAYFEIELLEQTDTKTRHEKPCEKIVVDLTHELNTWLQQANPKDAVRLISGGPGCGKSAFVKVFAEHQAKLNQVMVIFIPLHRFNLRDDLVEAINDFAHRYQDDYLPENPLDSKKPKLLIFDGLDEYAMQSKAANEAAQQFVDEVHKVVYQYNQDNTQLQAIITGREVAMQANARKFSKSRKTLHILGYYVSEKERESFQEADHLLAVDQRDQWWENYGQATGQSYSRIPDILKSDNLVEITSQPLLNYLIALSYESGKLDFSRQNNLNSIYRDLLERILEREQEKSPNSPLANLTFGEFFQALKEVALAAWHGDGRSTTQQEIQNYFKQRGLQSLLKIFADPEEKGVIRLLLAFYFRQTGIREEDAQGVFEFTHKSFGEYLVACRIVDLVEDIQEEMVLRRQTKPHLAWDENQALQHWIALCGIKPMDQYLFNFICDEMRLREAEQVHQWQETLANLIGYLLEHGLPMEWITPRLAYHDETRQARNAEEALLATLNACARVTQRLSKIQWPSPSAFGEWVYRIQGQSPRVEKILLLECLSFLDLHDCQIPVHNFQGANFYGANLENANLERGCHRKADFEQAILKNANLEDADLMDANLTKTNLEGANLNNAYLASACFEQANLKDATLKASSFYYANLKQAHLKGANLKQADLEGADTEGADFSGAIWTDGKKCLPNSIGEPLLD